MAQHEFVIVETHVELDPKLVRIFVDCQIRRYSLEDTPEIRLDVAKAIIFG